MADSISHHAFLLTWVCCLVITPFNCSQTKILALHPYFKLDWIVLHWGGAKEQEQDCAKGDLYAKNWQDEARKILEDLVHTGKPYHID